MPSRRKALGAMVRRARRDLGWTQAELAERSGRAENSIISIEKGSPTIRLPTLEDVASALGWQPSTVEAYLEGDDETVIQLRPRDRRPTPADGRGWIIAASIEELLARWHSIAETHDAATGDLWLAGALHLREAAIREAALEEGRRSMS